MRILVIGAGNMGYTYAEGMSKSKLLKKRNIMILDKSAETRDRMESLLRYDVYDDVSKCAPGADIIFIAVKPHHAADLFKELQPHLSSEQIIISIMAGVTIESLHSMSKINKIVRAMPNLPAQVAEGLTSYYTTPDITRVELYTIESLLNTTGTSIKVNSEKYIDASTGISGSGPAYVFYFMQAMMEAAMNMGFSASDSKKLVSQTFTGAIKLFNNSDETPTMWMDKVASKGGTTQAALDSMDNNNVNELIKEAAYAAFNRAIELGEEY